MIFSIWKIPFFLSGAGPIPLDTPRGLSSPFDNVSFYSTKSAHTVHLTVALPCMFHLSCKTSHDESVPWLWDPHSIITCLGSSGDKSIISSEIRYNLHFTVSSPVRWLADRFVKVDFTDVMTSRVPTLHPLAGLTSTLINIHARHGGQGIPPSRSRVLCAVVMAVLLLIDDHWILAGVKGRYRREVGGKRWDTFKGVWVGVMSKGVR